MPTTAETFEQIIRHQGADELVYFLLALDKEGITTVRKRVTTLAHELEDVRQQGAQHWEKGLTQLQRFLFFLASLATFSKKEALSRNFESTWYLDTIVSAHPLPNQAAYVQAILAHTKPSWLTEWVVESTHRNSWTVLLFNTLLDLSAHGFLEDNLWLLAQAAGHYLARQGTEIKIAHTLAGYLAGGIAITPQQARSWKWLQQYQPSLAADASRLSYQELLLADIQANTALLQRGVPLVFEYDTLLDSAGTYWTEGHTRHAITWLTLLPQLAASGHLDRADLLTRSLLALRRDFRRPLLTWFKNLFLSFQPTAAERLALQTELVELLAHPLPLVINFALDQLKDLWLEPDFVPALLLQYAEGLLARQDLKTGLRTLLSGCEKLLKRQPDLAPTLARLTTTALANADAAVQERAAKLLASILAAKKSLLTAEEKVEITGSISLYTDLLAAAARSVLAPFIANETGTTNLENQENTAATYVTLTDFQPDISPATAISPVADWHELLFLTGPALLTDDPAALERWLDGLLRLRPQFPADFARQLLPYLYQALPWQLKGQPEAEALRQARQYKFDNDRNGQRTLTLALLLGLLTNFEAPKVAAVTFTNRHYSSADPLLRVEQQRRVFVEQQLRTAARPLPLLSTPTHAPFWVAPTVLIDKLLAYEAAAQLPDPADLALALARTACHAAADATAARQRLSELQHTGLRQLLAWLLAPAGPAAPLPNLAASQSVGGLLTGLVRRFWADAAGALVPASLAEALPWLWAVAARTRYPDATFEELRPLADYPGVAAPWQPGWHFEQASQTYKQPWNKQQPEVTRTWQELRVPTEHQGQPAPSALLLYSLHARLRQNNNHYLWSLGADWQFLLSLLPNNPTPLHWHLLRTAYRTGDGYSEERDLMQKLLHSLLRLGPRFAEVTSVLLAVGLVHNAPECRALALEVLLAAIGAGRLVVSALGAALGQLLASEFAPVQRLAEGLSQARAISPITDDALRQTLDALLPALPAAPPRNTRKLLEAYADLLGRVPQPVPPAVQARLREWSASPSLKKAAAPLPAG